MSSPFQPPESSRRVAARRAIREDATLVHGTARIAVQTWDVGRDGISVIAARPIAPGTRCRVEFELRAGGTVRAIGASAKVVYSSYSAAGQFKIGAVFVDLDDESARSLERFASGP
ncbi:MAG: PilZ domain-containing protein [Caldimonas sp.]